MVNHSARPYMITCLPSEMVKGHCWNDAIGQEKDRMRTSWLNW